MFPVTAPLPIFMDRLGIPLENGALYFGTVNLNPETNPKTLYWDAAGTQPISQPVRTSAGLPMRSGSPAVIYADSEFSITVKDKNGVLIYYMPTFSGMQSLAPSTGAGLIGFIQNCTGAVIRTVLSKLREVKTVYDFMPDGFDTQNNDCAPYFKLAFNTGLPISAPGKFRVDTPIYTEAEVLAGAGAHVRLIGSDAIHNAFNGAAACEIDLSNNSTYFSAFGHAPFLSDVVFANGVDIIHHTSNGLDGNIVQLENVRTVNKGGGAGGFSGTFFKGFDKPNGSKIFWNNPVIQSYEPTAVIFDDTACTYGGVPTGFDSLTITNGWFETPSMVGFKSRVARVSVNHSRFVPYGHADPADDVASLWFDFYDPPNFVAFDTDFGGESARRLLNWRATGGAIKLDSCGVFYFPPGSIYLVGAPSRITIKNCEGWTNSTEAIQVVPGMSGTTLTTFSATVLEVDGNADLLYPILFGTSSDAAAFALAARAWADEKESVVQISDFVAHGGASWETGGSAGAGIYNEVTGALAPDIFGGDSQGYKFTMIADGGGYKYFTGGYGVMALATGCNTFEMVVTIEGLAACVGLLFGTNHVGQALNKTFWLAPGTHHICYPFYIAPAMTRTLGFQWSAKNGTILTFTRAKIFKGFYTKRKWEVYGAAAPTDINLLWIRGDRVINSVPTAGQPKAWVCTVSGTPGTWVSEGNL